MFTGLIEQIGTISVYRAIGAGREIAISWPGMKIGDAQTGDSIAISGACLTVERIEPERFWARLMPQTAGVTTLGSARVGHRVNLERALRVGDRLGGHFVLGHVDGIGGVAGAQKRGESLWLEVEFPADLTKYIAPKGSICIDGVSLTVAELGQQRFAVSLVKETLARTTLGGLRPGDKVNLEVDLLAKHLAVLLAQREGSPLTEINESRLLDLLT